jgi:hypothetical protein
VLAIAIAAIVLLVRWLGGTMARSNTPIAICPTPMDILKERFARGEIDKKRRRVPYTRLKFRRHPEEERIKTLTDGHIRVVPQQRRTPRQTPSMCGVSAL